MEIWLDTIDPTAIERAKDLGLLHGVTTNPAILAESKIPAEEILEELLKIYSGPLAVQVTSRTTTEMIEQGKDLYDFSSRIIVKVPAIVEGIEAIHRLSHQGIPVMATAIFEPIQALLAMKAGARYVAPYFSHIGENALSICLCMHHMLHQKCKLLVASLTSPTHIASCAESGFAAVTLKASLFNQCLTAPQQTLLHIERFEKAWSQGPSSKLLPAHQVAHG